MVETPRRQIRPRPRFLARLDRAPLAPALTRRGNLRSAVNARAAQNLPPARSFVPAKFAGGNWLTI
jgi:hypothetical protein